MRSNNNTTNTNKKDFSNAKKQCLGKRDKSSAGRLDPGAVAICGILNERDAYYTTSSCAGRCFLYSGQGIKATESFARYRVSHDKIDDPTRYLDLTTLESDLTGGGDPIKEFDGGRRMRQQQHASAQNANNDDDNHNSSSISPNPSPNQQDDSIWLRYEPFILHVACRSMAAASALMATARPTFKNVGLTSWRGDANKCLVAIWGDEGLDMPLTNQDGTSMITTTATTTTTTTTGGFSAEWIASLVNERHERNAAKIERLVQAVRNMPPDFDEEEEEADDYCNDNNETEDRGGHASSLKIPRSFDVIGDIALIHSLATDEPSEQHEIGRAIMRKNKAIKIVALRNSNLNGTERAPGESGLQIIAGRTDRVPLMTSHREYGIACIVDLHQTFFSPRMGPERIRLCQQTARGEHVLVLFAGVCMDALLMAARTEAATVTAIELNEVAVQCARRSHALLERNEQGVQCPGAAERLRILQGDCLEILPTLPQNHYNRILAPRPKEGSLDGNQPDSTAEKDGGKETGSGGAEFLAALLPVLKADGGECHWYDFAADHEFPKCERSVRLLSSVCREQGLAMQVLHVANAGSVAQRQLRVCVDFRVSPLA